MHAALSILMISLLAFAVGFATQRGSVCGLLAARQIVETWKRDTAPRLRDGIAVGAGDSGAAELGSEGLDCPQSIVRRGRRCGHRRGTLRPGTSLNGACMFGTLSRITSGNLSFIAARTGIALGVRVGTTIASPYLAFTLRSPLREPSLGGFTLLLLAA